MGVAPAELMAQRLDKHHKAKASDSRHKKRNSKTGGNYVKPQKIPESLNLIYYKIASSYLAPSLFESGGRIVKSYQSFGIR